MEGETVLTPTENFVFWTLVRNSISLGGIYTKKQYSLFLSGQLLEIIITHY